MPGAEQAIESAAGRGYEAVVLVVILLSMFGLMGYVIRYWLQKAGEREDKTMSQAFERETRLSARVTDLETFVREKLIQALSESTKATLTISVAMADIVKTTTELRESLHSTRPCFWTAEQQQKLVDAAADRLSQHVIAAMEKRLAKT